MYIGSFPTQHADLDDIRVDISFELGVDIVAPPDLWYSKSGESPTPRALRWHLVEDNHIFRAFEYAPDDGPDLYFVDVYPYIKTKAMKDMRDSWVLYRNSEVNVGNNPPAHGPFFPGLISEDRKDDEGSNYLVALLHYSDENGREMDEPVPIRTFSIFCCPHISLTHSNSLGR
jgi:hypothetical protein